MQPDTEPDRKPVFNDAGEITGWTYTTINGDTIPWINIQVQSVPITAQPRKLKAKWTSQLAEDLEMFHNVDIEKELTDEMAKQIVADIDVEIFKDIQKEFPRIEKEKKIKEIYSKLNSNKQLTTKEIDDMTKVIMEKMGYE